ncbi:MAG: hypothetical protein JJ992_07940, partial [Planctomycetes bacterium]|nr:hypothetical protein [Planctomycetota bacterium]
RLLVWASAEDQTSIEASLQKLTGSASPQFTPQLEVYRLAKVDPDAALALLQKLLPDAQLTLDKSNNLIALAVPADQQVIKATLDQLETGDADAPLLRFHPLSREPSENLVSVLKDLVPEAQITADTENKRLTVVATPADHETIERVVQEFEANTPPIEHGTLVIYPVTAAQQRRFESALAKLSEELPSVQVLPDSEVGEMAVWAKPTEHVRVAALLKQLESDTPAAEQPRLAAYPLQAAEPAAVSSVLTKLFPGIEVVIDEKTRKVMVWARLADQARISEAIRQIDSGKPGEWEEEFKAYHLQDADPSAAVAMLGELLPDVRFSTDAKAGTILAWGTRQDHDTIAKMLEEMQSAPATADAAVVYKLEGADATNMTYLVAFLGKSFPNARFTPGAQPGQLVAWASPKDHEQIKNLLDQLSQSPDGEPKVAVYDLKSVSAGSAQQVLQMAVPQAKITVDPETPQRLTVWARPSEQDTINSILQEIDVEGDGRHKSTIEVYSIPAISTSSAIYQIRTLSAAFPDARFSLGGEVGQIVAWASAEDHEQIKSLIQRMKTPAAEDKPALTLYTLKFVDAQRAIDVLKKITPEADLTADPADPKRLTAWAKPADHQTIENILQQIDVEEAAGSGYTAVIYSLEGMGSRASLYALRFLAGAVPNARITVGTDEEQLVVWATAKDHEQIKMLVDQLTKSPPPEQAPRVGVYALKSITAATAEDVLQRALPKAEFTLDPADKGRLTAWASPADHDTIKAILQEIDVEGQGSTASVAVYKLEGVKTAASAISAITLLSTAFPAAKFSAGTEPGEIVAWASARDHAEIKQLIDRLNAGPPPEQAPKAVVYTLQFIDATQVVQLLAKATPEANVTTDPDQPQRLAVWATPEDHATIESILGQIDVEGAADAGLTAVLYSLEGMDTRSGYYAYRFLTTAVPEARFSPGAQEGQILAWASAQDHQRIQMLVEQLTKAPPPEQAPTAAVYTVKFTTAATASDLLEKAVPKAEFTLDAADTGRMTVWASPADHETIKAILQQIDVEGEAGGSRVEVYQLEGSLTASSAVYALRLLATAFPNARFSGGTEPGQIVAWASTKDHTEIKALIDRLNAGPPPEKTPGVTVYKLQFIEAAQAQTVLQKAVPQASLTIDPTAPQRLTAWATPEDHETIASVLKTIDVQEAATSDFTVVIYSLEDMDPRSAVYAWRFLTGAVPNARLTPGAEPGQVVAWASAKDHERLKMLVEQLTDVAPEDAPKIAVYTTKFISASNASQILTTAVPRATVTVDVDDPQRLTVWARATDQDNIKAILQEIDVEGDAEGGSTVEVYSLQGGLTATS